MSANTPTPNSPATKKKILIVEDSEFVHQIYRVAFRRIGGFDLIHTNDGAQGLLALEKSGPVDLIIVDLNMPVMDGLTFLREVRKQELHRDTHALFCSTEGKDPAVAKQISSLAQSYLRKPFTLEQILAQLTEILPVAVRKEA